MDEQTYYRELGKKDARTLNRIINAVNHKDNKDSIGLADEVENMFYARMMVQALEHEVKYGKWPVFELCELD